MSELQPLIATSASWWMIKENWNLLMECHTILTTNPNRQQAECLGQISRHIHVEGMFDVDDLSDFVERGILTEDQASAWKVTREHLDKNALIAAKSIGLDRHQLTSDILDDHPELTCDAWKSRYPVTRAILKSGLTVINFSSGHDFIFDDGTVLKACHASRVKGLMGKVIETELEPVWDKSVDDEPFSKTIGVEFSLTGVLLDEMYKFIPANMDYVGDYVVIIPLPILLAFRATNTNRWSHEDIPFRTIRMAQRSTDNKASICRSDVFCW